jgi:hypothetical protein
MIKSFALFITFALVVLFSTLSISIIETDNICTNIDTLKYLHLQANIHMMYIKDYIANHTESQILTFSLDDLRYELRINNENENNQSKYHIYLKTKDSTPISIYSSVIKN